MQRIEAENSDNDGYHKQPGPEFGMGDQFKCNNEYYTSIDRQGNEPVVRIDPSLIDWYFWDDVQGEKSDDDRRNQSLEHPHAVIS